MHCHQSLQHCTSPLRNTACSGARTWGGSPQADGSKCGGSVTWYTSRGLRSAGKSPPAAAISVGGVADRWETSSTRREVHWCIAQSAACRRPYHFDVGACADGCAVSYVRPTECQGGDCRRQCEGFPDMRSSAHPLPVWAATRASWRSRRSRRLCMQWGRERCGATQNEMRLAGFQMKKSTRRITERLHSGGSCGCPDINVCGAGDAQRCLHRHVYGEAL